MGDFVLAKDHDARAVLLEMQNFGLRMRARDDVELGVQCAGLLYYLTALEGVGDGDEQAARGAEIGGGDDLGVRGIAPDVAVRFYAMTRSGTFFSASSSLTTPPTLPWPTSTTWFASAVGRIGSRAASSSSGSCAGFASGARCLSREA